MSFYVCLTLSCIGPLGPRGAVGARHNGFHHQLSPLLLVVCHGLNLCEGFAGSLRDVVSPGLFRPAPSSLAFDSSPVVSLLFSIQSSMSDKRHRPTIYSHTLTFTHACTHACMHARTHGRTNTHTHAQTHTHTHKHTHTHSRMHARTYARTHAHTHTHTHTLAHVRTHARTQARTHTRARIRTHTN